MTLTLVPGAVRLSDLERIYHEGGAARLDPACAPAIARAAARIAEVAAGEAPVYGVNTGFGKLASIRIAAPEMSGRPSRIQASLIAKRVAKLSQQSSTTDAERTVCRSSSPSSRRSRTR